jgi:carboxymethylenebutenolidase
MGEMVNFESNGGACDGYLAKPPALASGPAVVVIQEWWGLVGHIKDVCDRFAQEGFMALAPDLFHGESTKEPDEAGKLMMSLNTAGAITDLSGAISFLKGKGASKVGCVGFCMGGALSLVLATRADIDACVVYYGLPTPTMGEVDYSKLGGPVLCHFAEHDDWASQENAGPVLDQIRAAGKSAEMHVYKGTEHAFFNDSRPEVYHADAAAKSWERTIAFFRGNLD